MIAESQESATKLRMKRMQRAKEEEAKYQSARAEILDGAADDYSRRYSAVHCDNRSHLSHSVICKH